MKNSQNKLLALLFLVVSFIPLGISQDSVAFELDYEVNRIYPYITIAKDQLTNAQTLVDLNKDYKPSWIKEFIRVEILATHKGEIKRAASKNDILSQAQKELMTIADAGTKIVVNVSYMPNNNLKHNDVKELDFAFTVDPEKGASYAGGQQQLKQYLTEEMMTELSIDNFSIYNLAAVKFTIDEQGQVVDAHIVESSKEDKIDALLLETICNMPNWKPAIYADGTKVKQDFVLTVGDHRSCIIYTLSIRRD